MPKKAQRKYIHDFKATLFKKKREKKREITMLEKYVNYKSFKIALNYITIHVHSTHKSLLAAASVH